MRRVVFAGMAATVLSGCGGVPRKPERIPLLAVPIVYGGGREVETTFAIREKDWVALCAIFTPESRTPEEERARISEAIGLLERVAGEQTPTHLDRAKDAYDAVSRGQLDCVDESTNTETYLHLLEQRGFLKFHEMRPPRWRFTYLLDSHRTAVIRDRTDGREYAVDSWFGDNGEPADIQPMEDWVRKVPMPGRTGARQRALSAESDKSVVLETETVSDAETMGDSSTNRAPNE